MKRELSARFFIWKERISQAFDEGKTRWYNKKKEEKMKGLTDEQVIRSREEHGSNALTEIKGEGFFKKVWKNLGDPMIKILLVALAINVVFTALGQSKWFEPVGIALAILIATLVSSFTEYKNENAFRALQNEASKIVCKVYRNGEIRQVGIDEVVVGDRILIQTGDKIPADGTVAEGCVRVDQSVLNGESSEAEKKASSADADEKDFFDDHSLFRGSVVCSGNAEMTVLSVGDGTVYGKIAEQLQQTDDRESPLKIKLKKLAKQISTFGYIGGLFIALAFIFKCYFYNNGFDGGRIHAYFTENPLVPAHDAVSAVMLAVVTMVMAVPEGLPLMIAIVSAQNVRKMLKANVLVRKTEGIETAGSINILFSDKTGTITKGNLETIAFISGDGEEYRTFEEIPDCVRSVFCESVVQNTDAVMSAEGFLGGNATERAILGFIPKKQLESVKKREIKYVVPFNSANKYSLSVAETDCGAVTYVKGAPEKVLPACKGFLSADGEVLPIDGKRLTEKTDELAGREIRVVALAIKEEATDENDLNGKNFILVGVVGIRDEIREESAVAIREVKQAGVQVVMITGDRKETAVAIAKEVGLVEKEEDLAITSAELHEMSDEEVKKILPALRVVARALPEDKTRLVALAQENGMVVGMTGDGVNDSPALKKADVGFAMGSGTEVAKEAGDIVILDDNFRSIRNAVLYGRTIFNNIRKFIVFQLTINVAAVFLSLIAPLVGRESPLTITQILWINLIMDTLAALAFGGEPALEKYLKEKPKRRDENIVNGKMWGAIATDGAYMLIAGIVFLFVPFFISFFGENDMFGIRGNSFGTGFFTLFVLCAILNAFNARTESINLFSNMSKNKGFLRVMGLVLVVQILMVYFGSRVFNCFGLGVFEWLIILGLAIPVLFVDMARKAILRKIATK